MKLLGIMKKEFRRFFHDPKLVITMLLPGIILYLMYSIMGSVMNSNEVPKYEYTAYISGSSGIVQRIEMTVSEIKGEAWNFIPATDAEEAKKLVEEGEAAAYLVFPEGFDDAVASYDPLSGKPAPMLEIYYSSADEESRTFYSITQSVFASFNKFQVAGKDFSTEAEMFTSVLGGLLPFLVVTLIFSTCMSVTLESVAGEKERGTLATLLITSVKRSHIALGKVLSLSCIVSIGALSSFLGVALSMPKLMGLSVGAFASEIGFGGYLLLFLLILSVVPLIVSIMSALSALAKSVKEASAYSSVIMIVTMLLSLVTAFVSGIGDWAVAIPLLNAVVCMQHVITGSHVVWQSIVTFAMNVGCTALVVFGISKMLSSEKIMFGS